MSPFERGWRVIKRRWYVLGACIGLGALIAVLYGSAQPSMYTASTDLFLRAPDVKTSAGAYQGNLFTLQRANTYVKLVESDDLAKQVATALRLNISPHQLASDVSASGLKDTVLITISVKDRDVQQAVRIANAYGDVFGNYVAQVERGDLSSDAPPLVTQVRAASVDTAESTGLPPWLMALLGSAVGLVVGVPAVWMMERYDKRIRTREEIEDVAGTRIIGSLPTLKRAAAKPGFVQYAFDTSPSFVGAARIISVNMEHRFGETRELEDVTVISVVSVHPGDGKSVVAEAVGRAFAERGRKVELVRVGLPGMSTAELRVENDVTLGRRSAEPSMLNTRTISSVEDVALEFTLESTIADLAGRDFVIVDGPAATSERSAEAQTIASVSDAALIVARPGADRRSLADLMSGLAMLHTPVIGIVMNRSAEPDGVGFHAR